ncbi:MAG: peptide deformylase [Rickettsiales bacterium]|nr:peptide deformylase [Rickettsiales bacterium]
MTILPLIIGPDPFLNEVSQPVKDVNDEIRTLLDDMLETMYDAKGIGLAAAQVGHHKRVIVIDVEWKESDFASRAPLKLINAELVEESEQDASYNEGCLSFPEQYSEVIRPESVTVKYLDENGKPQTLKAEGMLATCVQHEIDHTNGITFVQHISRLKRDRIVKKLQKMKKAGAFDYVDCGDPSCGHDHH